MKRDAGTRWENAREAICNRLEGMLRQQLGPSDYFVPLNPTAYLVVMPASTPEEGQICCARICYELHCSVLGACGVEHLEVSPAECVGDDTLEVRPFSRLELLELAEKADLILAAPGTGSFDGDSTEPPPPSAPAPPSLKIDYQPVWDAQFEVIRAYCCIYDRSLAGSVGLTVKEETRERSQLALAALARVEEVLQAHLARNERFIVNLPVAYGALTSPLARMEFTAACRRLPCELRPYLIFKIEDLPIGVPRSRLVELVTTIGPFCRGVIAKPPRSEHALDIYRDVGLKALGMGLQSASLAAATNAIERLCAEAKHEKLYAFLDDVSDVPTLRLALKAGVKWISGAAVLPCVSEPGPLMHISLNRLINETVA